MPRLTLLCALLYHAAASAEPSVNSGARAIGAADAIRLEVEHQLSCEEAQERVGYLLAYWAQRFGIESLWEGEHVYLAGSVFGRSIHARFDVTSKGVSAVALDPGWFWRSQMEAYVRKKLEKYLSPTYSSQ